jgi:hypothetical protein
MEQRSAWQAAILTQAERLGFFICGIAEGDKRLQEAQARDYRHFQADRAEMFKELDSLVDKGLLTRHRHAEGIMYKIRPVSAGGV